MARVTVLHHRRRPRRHLTKMRASRLRISTSTGHFMGTPEPPPLDTAEFKAVRAELCRLFIARKADLGLAARNDAEIVARIDDITLYLAARLGAAQMTGDQLFIERFGWLIEAFDRLDAMQPVSRLDA
jgi:hypothetical protein